MKKLPIKQEILEKYQLDKLKNHLSINFHYEFEEIEDYKISNSNNLYNLCVSKIQNIISLNQYLCDKNNILYIENPNNDYEFEKNVFNKITQETQEVDFLIRHWNSFFNDPEKANANLNRLARHFIATLYVNKEHNQDYSHLYFLKHLHIKHFYKNFNILHCLTNSQQVSKNTFLENLYSLYYSTSNYLHKESNPISNFVFIAFLHKSLMHSSFKKDPIANLDLILEFVELFPTLDFKYLIDQNFTFLSDDYKNIILSYYEQKQLNKNIITLPENEKSKIIHKI